MAGKRNLPNVESTSGNCDTFYSWTLSILTSRVILTILPSSPITGSQTGNKEKEALGKLNCTRFYH